MLFWYEIPHIEKSHKKINRYTKEYRKNSRKKIDIPDNEARYFFWKEESRTKIHESNIHHKPYPRTNHDISNCVKKRSFRWISIESTHPKNDSPKYDSRNNEGEKLLFRNIRDWELYTRDPISDLPQVISKEKYRHYSCELKNRSNYRLYDFMSFHEWYLKRIILSLLSREVLTIFVC